MNDKLYVIAIGGSGAKCVESIVQVAATGLYSPEAIEILMIDPDENNGNVDRARKTIATYQDIQKTISGGNSGIPGAWMSTPISAYELWSPFQDKPFNRELVSFFSYSTMRNNNPALANLLEVLYTPEERQQKLDEGFRGRPSIGAAVMSQIDLKQLDTKPWGEIVQSISNAVGSKGQTAKILLCGSIFGGTGASGIPTIARLLRNKLKEGNIIDKVKIGGIFLLPYFSFTVPPGASTDGLYASADQFMMNTEAALRYYVKHAKQLFDTVYLLGNENSTNVNFSVGNLTQKNTPHFVELYAALATRDFLKETRDDAIVTIGRNQSGVLTWGDLPDGDSVKVAMSNTARLAYLWTSYMEGQLRDVGGVDFRRAQSFLPWLGNYYDPSPDSEVRLDHPEQQKALSTLSEWSRNHMTWLKDMHTCDSDRITLFNTQFFGDLNGHIQRGKLSDLIFEDPRDPRTRKDRDDLGAITARLRCHNPQKLDGVRGTVGLVKSLLQHSTMN
jgi:hypothetical protein